jgi:hypothetical protein
MRWTRIILGTVAATLALTPAAHAATFTVTGTADIGGSCTGNQCTSIRAALAAAAAPENPDGDTIILQSDTYALGSTGALAITTPVTLRGGGARDTVIQASGETRVLDISAAATISHLTVANGVALDGFGGNIRNMGATVSLDHVRVTGGNASTGAGIANLHGTVLIDDSLIDANAAQTTGGASTVEDAAGGGISNHGDGLGSASLTLRNSTVALNTAYQAGGIVNYGNAQNTVTLENVTVARNGAGSGGTGGIYNGGGLLAVGSSVVANNYIFNGPLSDCGGTESSSQGWNVESGDTCGFRQEPDHRNVGDAGLAAAVSDSGGETNVLAPNLDSPAINSKSPGDCLPADQRGTVRPQGPACDSGAVELTYPVRIDNGPPATTSESAAQFAFSSTMAPDEFQCGLAGPSAPTPAYAPCQSGVSYDTLADGAYTFHVRAIESGETVGEVTRDFTVSTGGGPAPITIDSGPEGPTNQTKATFTFSSSPGAQFDCQLYTPTDSDPAYEPCTSPYTRDGLVDGGYYFIVAPAGTHEYEFSAYRDFTVDTVKPDPPVIDQPANGGIVGAHNIIASGTAESVSKITIGDGAAGRVATTETDDSGHWQAGVAGLAEGRHDLTFVTTDEAGNDSDPTTVTTTVDTTAPVATITSGPAGGTNKTTADFTYEANEDATFECRLDIGNEPTRYGECPSSGKTYSTLINRVTYVFRVRATDSFGHTGEEVTRSFTVNTGLPDTPVIDTPTDNPHYQSEETVTLSGTGSPGSTVVLVNGGTAPVTDGRWTFALNAQAEGRHDYTVRAENAAGQTGTDSTTVYVDHTAPDTTIDSGPVAAGFNGVEFGFSSNESGAQFTCKLAGIFNGDTPPQGGCSSPQSYQSLREGESYTLTVFATDRAGNVDSTPASLTFIYDHVPPVTHIDSTWQSPTNDSTPTIAFSADPGSSFVCHVDGDPDAPCISPLTLATLTDGGHVFFVKATDPAGNVQQDYTTFSFVVDTIAPEPPAITSPDADAAQTVNSVRLRGTASGAVDVYDNGTLVKSVPYDDGIWVVGLSNLGEGEHVFTARTFDAAGNPSALSAPRKVTVDTVAPTVTITSIPPSLTNQFTFDILFSVSEPGVTLECKHFRPEELVAELSNCSPWSFRELGDGTHRFEITATDAAGNVGPTVSREVTIDSAVPDPVEPSPVDATTFAFSPKEPDAAFECRLDGPGGDSGFVPCQSPKAYSGLAPGNYSFTLRTLDAAGNHADANPRAFSVSPPQDPTPTPTPIAAVSPTPTPTVTPTPPPTPEIAETIVVRPLSGQILVRVPGSDQFVELDATKGFPVGTEIDARNGKIQLTSEPGQGKPVQKAIFYGGIFTIAQGNDGFVELKLSEELAPCSKKKKASAAAKKPKTRKLWGDGKGKFRTRGQYSAATIRGTRWLVEDSCEGTLTTVKNGVVSVRDFSGKKTILVRGGKSYLAKPKR